MSDELIYFIPAIASPILHHFPACSIYIVRGVVCLARARTRQNTRRSTGRGEGIMRDEINGRENIAKFHLGAFSRRDSFFLCRISVGDAFINQARRYNRLEYGRGCFNPFVSSAAAALSRCLFLNLSPSREFLR